METENIAWPQGKGALKQQCYFFSIIFEYNVLKDADCKLFLSTYLTQKNEINQESHTIDYVRI